MTTEPTAAERSEDPKGRHRNVRRPAFFLGVGAGGVIAGLAMCAALAHPASAASLPVATPRNTIAPVATVVTAAVAPLTNLAASPTTVLPIASKSLDSVTAGALRSVGTVAVPVRNAVVGAVLPTVRSATAPALGSGSPTATVGTARFATPPVPPASAGLAVRPSDVRTGSSSRTPTAPKLPISPTRVPTAPAPTPIAPPPADTSSSGSSAGQGSGPFGAFPRQA